MSVIARSDVRIWVNVSPVLTALRACVQVFAPNGMLGGIDNVSQTAATRARSDIIQDWSLVSILGGLCFSRHVLQMPRELSNMYERHLPLQKRFNMQSSLMGTLRADL